MNNYYIEEINNMDFNQKNKIVKNVLNENEVLQLKEIIKNSEKFEQTSWCRDIINIEIPETILQKFKNIAHEYGHKDLELSYQVYVKYKKIKNNNPQCPPHVDNSDTQFSIDYQLDSNIAWPLVVEENDHLLSNNDLLIMSAKSQVHWRPEKIFNENDYCEMIILHFVLNSYRLREAKGLISYAPENSFIDAFKRYDSKNEIRLHDYMKKYLTEEILQNNNIVFVKD